MGSGKPSTTIYQGMSGPYHSTVTHMRRVGQDRVYTPYMTVYLVISLPKIPYIHRMYRVLANPTHARYGAGGQAYVLCRSSGNWPQPEARASVRSNHEPYRTKSHTVPRAIYRTKSHTVQRAIPYIHQCSAEVGHLAHCL